MSDTPAREPWADFLDNPPASQPDAAFQRRLLEQSRRLLRRRVWLKRAVFAAALAACFLAGIVTSGWLQSVAAPPTVVIVTNRRTLPSSRDEEAVAGLSALVLENRAFDSERPRPELYRLAGDRYLAESGDLQSALLCYRRALDESSDRDLQIQPEDNWLLIALKESRQKEKENAKLVD
jgi:hypothetical protein